MRVLYCKSYCPFVCSSKSAVSIYSPCLENARNVSSSPQPTTHVLEGGLCDEKTDVVKRELDDDKGGVVLKSSLKKLPKSGEAKVGKGRVKWMDYVGKELVEIREFEHIESMEADDYPACICVIQ